MAPSVVLTIPHELNASRKKDNLQSQVQQLVLQKGPFRNVTESSLLDDIQRHATEVEDREEGSDDNLDSATETVQATREKLFQIRAEYVQMSS